MSQKRTQRDNRGSGHSLALAGAIRVFSREVAKIANPLLRRQNENCTVY
jgi:hypothetical protein